MVILEQKLSKLSPGDTGTIVRVEGSGQIRKRIMDMGLTPGAKIEMIRCAPMGDPVEFKLRGYLLTLRKNEADTIFVSMEATE